MKSRTDELKESIYKLWGEIPTIHKLTVNRLINYVVELHDLEMKEMS